MKVIGIVPNSREVYITNIPGHLDGIKEFLGENITMIELGDNILMLYNRNTAKAKSSVIIQGVEIFGQVFFANGSQEGKITSLSEHQIRKILRDFSYLSNNEIEKAIRIVS